MISMQEGRLHFEFPETSDVTRYDEWTFYRRRFQNKCGEGNKAVDFICLYGETVWFIEVKDYRGHNRQKESSLPDEVTQKVRDTLAGLAAAVWNATECREVTFARNAFQQQRACVVVHLEQPRQPSRLRPRLDAIARYSTAALESRWARIRGGSDNAPDETHSLART